MPLDDDRVFDIARSAVAELRAILLSALIGSVRAIPRAPRTTPEPEVTEVNAEEDRRHPPGW